MDRTYGYSRYAVSSVSDDVFAGSSEGNAVSSGDISGWGGVSESAGRSDGGG